MNDASIAELAASLKSTGLIQPIIVRQVPDGFQLIAGERRWRAAKLAGLATIPAIVRDVDSFTQAQMALVENIQREDLNPLDRAESYKALMNQLGLTQAELAGRLGEERSSIANYLRLLDLTPMVRDVQLQEDALHVQAARVYWLLEQGGRQAGVDLFLGEVQTGKLEAQQRGGVRAHGTVRAKSGTPIPQLLREKKLLAEEEIARIFTPEFLAGQADRKNDEG